MVTQKWIYRSWRLSDHLPNAKMLDGLRGSATASTDIKPSRTPSSPKVIQATTDPRSLAMAEADGCRLKFA